MLKMLAARLRDEFTEVKISDGVDGTGEDAILHRDGQRLVVQITILVPDVAFWSEARGGRGEFQLTTAQAAKIIRSALVKKAGTSPDLLALDASQTGIFSDSRILEAYLDKYGDPRQEFGFSEVWIVGATAATTERLEGAS